MLWGKKQTSIFLIAILILIIFPILQIPNTAGDLSNPSTLTPHNTIFIYGNSQFTSINGVLGGNGTKSNPYIIENWSIDATNEHGICIVNTNAHFIIRNCYIFNGSNSSSSHKTGIYLENIDNGIVKNNRLISNENGIYLSDSNNCTISNNTCKFNDRIDIYLSYSENNTISNNTCTFPFG